MIIPLILKTVDWSEILPAVVMLLIVGVSWVINKVNEARQQAELQRPSPPIDENKEDGMSPGDQAGEAGEVRRERLPTSSGQPENLTLAERIERARAQARYGARADQLTRRQHPEPTSPVAATPTPRREPVQRPDRSEDRRTARGVARKRSGTVRKATVEKGRTQEGEHARRVARAAEQQRRLAAPTRVTRTASPAPVKRTDLLGRLGAKELRRAIVLKELLDPPLALRDSCTSRL